MKRKNKLKKNLNSKFHKIEKELIEEYKIKEFETNELKENNILASHYEFDSEFISSNLNNVKTHNDSYNIAKIHQYSAKYTFSKAQGIIFITLCSILFYNMSFFFIETLTIIALLINFINISLIFIGYILFYQKIKNQNIFDSQEYHDFIKKIYSKKFSTAPLYTILLPSYKEDRIIIELIENIKKIKYPNLEVFLIIENDDLETQKILHQKKLPKNFKIIIVPPGYPKTKARACNYCLPYINGKYFVIYDADDIPDQDQILKAVFTFEKDHNLVSLQAKLSYYNFSENWLTRMFQIEYIALFSHTLKSLTKLNLPIPLGGSSNHFRTYIIRVLGGWDNYNVTEDAELGMRIAVNNMKTCMLDSNTLEEAPISLKSWTKQRIRWIKGHMQTYLCYTRSPLNTIKKIKFFGFISMHYMLGFSYMISILYCISFYLSIHIFIIKEFEISNTLKSFHLVILATSILTLILGYIFFLLKAYKIAKKHNYKKIYKYQKSKLYLDIFSYPLYFFLHLFASILSIIELLIKPHHWNKTKHGLTSYKLKKNQND